MVKNAKPREKEKRPNGWQIRCIKCDFVQPWGDFRVRPKTGSRKYIFGRCHHCKRIRFLVVEQVPNLPAH